MNPNIQQNGDVSSGSPPLPQNGMEQSGQNGVPQQSQLPGEAQGQVAETDGGTVPPGASAPQVDVTAVPSGSSQEQPQTPGTEGANKSSSKTGDAPTAMEAYQQKQRQKVKKEREIIRAREKDVDLGKRLGELIIPFVSLGILVLIVVFVFIPFTTEVRETRKSTQLLLDDIERNESKIEAVQNINLSELEDHLIVAGTVVRDSMDVAELAIEVERLALKHDLEPSSQKATNTEDVVLDTSTLDTDWVPSYADAVSGPFSYKGKFKDVTNFLSELRNKSKTILSLGSIKMSKGRVTSESMDEQETKNMWTIDLLISGYTAQPVQETSISEPIRTELNMDILEQIYQRAGLEIGDEVSAEEEEEEADSQSEGDGNGESEEGQSPDGE